MNAIEWILRYLKPRPCASTELLYDAMESQSGRQLPLIYVPFDAFQPGHWADRGSALDYALSAGPGRILDFGPGDGWPSLIISPFVEEVVGVDASERRVAECARNARRMGIKNAAFIHVRPGHPLPFEEQTFDGAVAASSIENSPDPEAVLSEIFRVLRPGGCLRVSYESLGRYQGGQEREAYLNFDHLPHAALVIHERHIEEEWARQFKIIFDCFPGTVRRCFEEAGQAVSYNGLTPPLLETLCPYVSEALVCATRHPSGPTLAKWLSRAGFSSINPTRDGATAAKMLFANTATSKYPTDAAGVDAILRPAVAAAVKTHRRLSEDPMITAVRQGSAKHIENAPQVDGQCVSGIDRLPLPLPLPPVFFIQKQVDSLPEGIRRLISGPAGCADGIQEGLLEWNAAAAAFAPAEVPVEGSHFLFG